MDYILRKLIILSINVQKIAIKENINAFKHISNPNKEIIDLMKLY